MNVELDLISIFQARQSICRLCETYLGASLCKAGHFGMDHFNVCYTSSPSTQRAGVACQTTRKGGQIDSGAVAWALQGWHGYYGPFQTSSPSIQRADVCGAPRSIALGLGSGSSQTMYSRKLRYKCTTALPTPVVTKGKSQGSQGR